MAFVKDTNVVREVLNNYINDSSLSYRKLGASPDKLTINLRLNLKKDINIKTTK